MNTHRYEIIYLWLWTTSISAQNLTPRPNPGFNCGQTISWNGLSPQIGEISSANWPDANYPPNQNCQWLLLAPIGVNITMTITDITLESDRQITNQCNFDSLEIIMPPFTDRFGRYVKCDEDPDSLPALSTLNGRIEILFNSDEAIEEAGFNIVWIMEFADIEVVPPDFVGGDIAESTTIFVTSSEASSSSVFLTADRNTSTEQNDISTIGSTVEASIASVIKDSKNNEDDKTFDLPGRFPIQRNTQGNDIFINILPNRNSNQNVSAPNKPKNFIIILSVTLTILFVSAAIITSLIYFFKYKHFWRILKIKDAEMKGDLVFGSVVPKDI